MIHVEDMTESCVFCEIDPGKITATNELAFALFDGFPVALGHTLVVPHRHVADFFELTQEEHQAVFQLVAEMRERLLSEDDSIDGFNVGVNAGSVAGQTIFHCHVHLIPRREGDVEDPRGGVRGVIPDKQHYL